MRRLLLLFTLVLAAFGVYAQGGIVAGQIVDEETGEPLIGANAFIQGTTIGSVADLDGNFTISEEDSFDLLRRFVEESKSLPNFRILSVNGQYFNNAGASIVQELAFSLAMGNDYLAKITDKAIIIDDIAPRYRRGEEALLCSIDKGAAETIPKWNKQKL